ncbi:unnamed protein product [[Candida] boidinii]|uniref:Unnamed protein product n=1 Tax=Candida boidinii TaxID=5477 RepID=A0ACB5TWL9_CANBO|nr:unnamed protein product [[Candida] boidinii]
MNSKLYSPIASHSNITRNQNSVTSDGMNTPSSVVHPASQHNQTSSLSVSPTAISAKKANLRVSSRDMLHSFIEHNNNSNINNNGISWISNRLIPTLTSTTNNQNQNQNQNQESVAKIDTDDNSNTSNNLSSRLGSFETSFLKYLYVEQAPEMGLNSTPSNPFTENQSPFHSVFSNYHSSEVAETISDSPPLREDQKAVRNSLQDSHKNGTQKNPHQSTSESTNEAVSKKEVPASTSNALPISLTEEQELTLTPTLSSSSLISGQNLSISASSLSSTALSHLGSLVSHLIPDSTVAYADVGKILNPDPPSPRRVLKSRDPRKLETYRYIRNNNETSSFIPIDTTARHTRRDFRSKSIESRIELNKQYQRGLYNQRNPTRNSTNFGNGQNLGSFTGSHSTLYLTKNGNKVVQHGAASSMNNHVLSTRVSHNSLKEALDSSFF